MKAKGTGKLAQSEEAKSPAGHKPMPKSILKKTPAKEDLSHLVIREDTSECKGSSSKDVTGIGVTMTPVQKDKKKLQVMPSKFMSKDATNSAMLPNKSMKFKNLNRFRRMSTLGQHQFNKSLANNFEFKDLKEFAQSVDHESSATKEAIKLHGTSLCIFGKTNKIRIWIQKLVTHAWFDIVILCCIMISSITLAIENPLNDPKSNLSKNLEILNMTMTFIFLLECMLKIVAKGFIVNGKGSYLRNVWDIVDFFIVIISLLSIVTASDLSVFKAIRVLRLLRPLRVIQRNEGLKVAVQALFMAVPNILYVSVIAVLFFAIFGMTGVNMFKGKFYYCHGIDDSQLLHSVLDMKD